MNPREYETMYSVEDTYWWYAGMRRITRAVFPDASAMTGGRLLDAGSGTGANLAHLRDQAAGGYHAGVDRSFEAIRFSRRRGLSGLLVADLTRLPFVDGAFDIVTCHDVMYCVPDDAAGFSELFRVARTGARLFVSSAALEILESEHDSAVHAVRRYSRRGFREKIRAAGFDIERLTFANTLLFVPILAIRLFLRAISRGENRGEAASDFHRSPRLLNAVLTRILYLEAFLLEFIDLPVGVTIMACARKPEADVRLAPAHSDDTPSGSPHART
ncbi:MAG: methyltransferase domain-containing protein [Acidobacteria bacterium]|nr:methyltransferase domain-containing protein [Acidobacteriota bacterium]